MRVFDDTTTNLIRRQKSHPDGDPAALARAEYECFLHS